MSSSTGNYSLNAIRGCGQIPLPQSQLVDRMIERCIQMDGILCVGTRWAAGSKEENAHHQCHFFTYIPLEFRWCLRTRKVNLLLQESQYFTITLGSDLKGHFVHSIYFFTHMYIVIPCHRYLGAEWFHKAASFEAPGLYKANKRPMSHQEN